MIPKHITYIIFQGSCPLLSDAKTYNADTVGLFRDNDARDYWLQCLEDSLPKFTDRAVQSQAHSESAVERANLFKNQVEILTIIKNRSLNNL